MFKNIHIIRQLRSESKRKVKIVVVGQRKPFFRETTVFQCRISSRVFPIDERSGDGCHAVASLQKPMGARPVFT